ALYSLSLHDALPIFTSAGDTAGSIGSAPPRPWRPPCAASATPASATVPITLARCFMQIILKAAIQKRSCAGVPNLFPQQPLQRAELVRVHMGHRVFRAAGLSETGVRRGVPVEA